MFLVPFIQTIIFGFAIDMDIQHITTVVFDMDQSTESRRIIDQFVHTQAFDLRKEVYSEADVRREIVKIAVEYGKDLNDDRKNGGLNENQTGCDRPLALSPFVKQVRERAGEQAADSEK